jgi:hypothetical protein
VVPWLLRVRVVASPGFVLVVAVLRRIVAGIVSRFFRQSCGIVIGGFDTKRNVLCR